MTDSPSDHPVSTPVGKVLFADAFAAALLEGRLGEICRPNGQWQLVKENSARRIYRGRIAGREIYVKHFFARSLRHRLLGLIGLDGARKEFDSALLLRRCGVPTLPVLALVNGPVRTLASEAVRPAIPGDTWHLRQLSAGRAGQGAIRQATRRLADLVARMHQAGVSHEDLHCGNLLVRPGPDGVELVLMDLHRISRRRRLSRRRRAADLAQLMHDRRDLTTRADRLRFLKEYLRVSQAEGTLRGWRMLVESFARRHRRRQYAHLDRRVLGRNKYFAPVRLPGGWSGHVMLAAKHPPYDSPAAGSQFTAAQWQEALTDVEALLRDPSVESIKDSRSVRVIRQRLTVNGKALDVFIKQPKRRSLWKFLAGCVRPSRVRRAFRYGQALLSRRVPTAIPLAFLERRWGPLLLDSALIAEAVEGQPLNRFMEAVLSPGPRGDPSFSAAQRRQISQEVLWQMGRMLQRLHDSHFAHRDLKETNILVRWHRPGMPQVVLLDLDGLRRVRRMTAKRRFQGLMRLNVSLIRCSVVNRAGRLRMLLGYLRRPGGGRINFKPYWRMLEDWSAKVIQHRIRYQRRRQKAVRRPTAFDGKLQAPNPKSQTNGK